ncbi:hypothetical protein CRM22_003810 [Opisthorchis felineus]|uniref:Uncharacterized protein n=1 Tax=Opisthorchis felineus TaxID=147828 RepID=A0A4S2M003_OPIFE|nr:hypothetical protein CRM22_003810 [Opisthorchis felineus]
MACCQNRHLISQDGTTDSSSRRYIYVLHHPDCEGNCADQVKCSGPKHCESSQCHLLHYKPEYIEHQCPKANCPCICNFTTRTDTDSDEYLHGPIQVHRDTNPRIIQRIYHQEIQPNLCRMGSAVACPCVRELFEHSAHRLVELVKYRDMSPSEGYWKIKKWHGEV